MKRFYAKFSIALMTFAFGLASVFPASGSLDPFDKVAVNLPETDGESIVLIYPKLSSEIPASKASLKNCSRKIVKLEENNSDHK